MVVNENKAFICFIFLFNIKWICEVNLMEITLSKATLADKEILYRLLQYSLFEESENDLNEMTEDAIFNYKYFNLYFSDKDRDAYFIRENVSNKLLGFVMVNTFLQKFKEGHSVAEFMVIPKYRRQGIGEKAAIKIFEYYPGNWEVKPSLNSKKAYLFWKNTIDKYTNGKYEIENDLILFTK